MKKVKNVKFNLTWKGEGCVNYNGSEHSNELYKAGVKCPTHLENGEIKKNANVLFGKSNFYKVTDDKGNEKVIRVPKVSANCIRNAMFNNVKYFNPQVFYNPAICANFITSPAGFMKGHMLTPTNGSYTRSSCVMVSDLVAKDAVYGMETFTNGSAVDENGNKSETSLFNKETLGEVTYTSTVVFDVAKAQFLCLDPQFGQQSLPSEVYENGVLEKAFEHKLGRIPYTEGTFTDSSDCFGEYYAQFGYKFDDEFINYLLNNLIEILWKTKIVKSGAYLELDKIEMYVETDPLSDEKEYVQLKKQDCGTYKFEYEDFWKPGTRCNFEKTNN